MNQVIKCFALLPALLVVCTAPLAYAQILDDHFDDGVLETNTSGIGSGFKPVVLGGGGTISEVDSDALFSLAGLQALWSNDDLDLFTSTGTKTTFQVSGGSVEGNLPYDFELGGANGRIWLGLVTASANTDSFALPLDSTPQRHGLWVSLYDTIDGGGFNQATLGGGTNPNDYNGQLGWVSATGERTILAQFTYDSYLLNDPAHNAIDVIMTVSDSAYAVSFAGPDSGVTLQNGALSGSLPTAPSGLFKLATTIQSGGSAPTASLEIDRILVETFAIPEPSTLSLFAVALLGGLGLIRRSF